ncbi:MAG: hypothetical protein HYX23_01895 [Candidatus Zambryskibacteria bacterium]|nr:hypothetical protein [Candidatus Zambryskibacteria bacterium]
MKKYFPHISIFFLTFVLVFMISGFLFPQTVRADYCVISGIPQPEMSKEECDYAIIPGFPKGQWVPGTPPTYSFSDFKEELAKGLSFTRIFDFLADAFLAPLGWLAILILQIASLFTYLGGIILNFIVQTTVVDMAKNLKDMDAINIAWKTIRDVANMGFIFILLYAAIQTILGIGSDTKKLIVNIVVVAILINFSLFFTKVVIDASNVLAITFYDAIAPDALTSNVSLGLSNSLMEPLKITSLWRITSPSDLFAGKKLIIVGVMGTIVSLVAAFVFFAVAIMFAIRFVVLIFVMILSPLAFMGYILPQLKKHKDEWVQALLGQAFFAPIYFMLTWIVIVVSRGLFASAGFTGAGSTASMAQNFTGIAGADGNFTPPPAGSLALLMNFIIMIVFLIASLVIAKQWANKAGHGVPGLTKWATGLAGGATLGMAGRLGRGTIGRASQAVGESETLKRWRDKAVARGGLTGSTFGAGIRLTQAVAKKGGSSSFDLRASALGGQLDAGKAQMGGYEAARKEANKREEEYAKSQEPSDKAKAEAKIARVAAIKEIDAVRQEIKNPNLTEEQRETILKRALNARREKQRADNLLGNKEDVERRARAKEEDRKKKVENIRNSEELKAAELAERSAQDTVNRLEAEAKAAMGTTDQDRREAEVEAAKENLKTTQEAAKEIRRVNREAIEGVTKTYDRQITAIKAREIKSAGDKRKAAHADWVENSLWAKFGGYNYTAAAQIRKGKSNKDKLVEAAAALAKETSEGEKPEAETPTTPPSTPPVSPTAGTTPNP